MRHYENAPQRLHTTFKGLTPLQHYFAFTKVYICAKVAYYISPRCVHCKKVHKKQQTITSFSQKLHKSSDTKKRRRPTHKQGVRLYTRTIVTKVPRAVYKDKQDALNKLYFGRISTSESAQQKHNQHFGVRAHGVCTRKCLLLCAHVIPFPPKYL